MVSGRMDVPSSSSRDAYWYVYSCELMTNIQIKICEFDGNFRDALNPTRRLDQLVVEATVYCDGRAVGFPVSTSFKPPVEGNHSRVIQSWNEWLTLPVKYSDLSRDSFVHFCIWELDVEDSCPIVPASTIPALLDGSNWLALPKKLVCQTSMKFFSKRGVLKSGQIDLQMQLALKPNAFSENGQDWRYGRSQEAVEDHLVHLMKQAERQKRNIVDSVIWLDQITKPVIEQIKETRKNSHKNVFMLVEMASVNYGPQQFDVIYYENDTTDLRVISASTIQNRMAGDPELGLDNLCEEMHTTMTRKTRSLDAAKKLKPNKHLKDRLEFILKIPSSHCLTVEQRDLIWRFRFYLKHDRRALNKFLHSIHWDKEKEVAEALVLLNDWSPIEAEDALELLSPQFSNSSVREYAVSRLEYSATPEQVLLYLPQLVQALKYEPARATDIVQVVQPDPVVNSTDLAELVEKMDELDIQKSNDLASFLIKYCTAYLKIANFLFWHLKVEEEVTKDEPAMSLMYKNLRQRLLDALNAHNVESRKQALSLAAQVTFVENLKSITSEAKAKSQRRDQRESALRTKLAKDPRMKDFGDLILPLDPTQKIRCVLPDSASLYSSAMMPAKLTFTTTSHDGKSGEYTLIFKQGDDLRQDQLVIQMIRLMDSLFKRDQLDLKMTPYAVLATGMDEGFVQFVKARPLRDVLKRYSDYKDRAILEAMRESRPDAKGPFGVDAIVMDNYIRSLAGYSVVSYVLGIGDRHLDNLLLCENGRLFHVDFGYILGRDPKPMPAAMKITNEMIAAFGGAEGKEFRDFLTLCDSAYRILRRHANVILNLFSLMLDAGIPNIAEEKDKAVFKVEQRLKLELNDQEAYAYITGVVISSVTAKVPVIVDFIHDWNQRLSW